MTFNFQQYLKQYFFVIRVHVLSESRILDKMDAFVEANKTKQPDIWVDYTLLPCEKEEDMLELYLVLPINTVVMDVDKLADIIILYLQK